MSRALQMIAISYWGEPCDPTVAATLGEVLRGHCDPSGIHITALKGDDIHLLVANGLVDAICSNVAAEHKEEYNAEENAVIYVGTVLKDYLGPAYKAENFMSALLQKIAEARALPDREESKRFMNALFILSQENLSISQSLLKKYRLNEKKILIIKRVYNLISNG